MKKLNILMTAFLMMAVLVSCAAGETKDNTLSGDDVITGDINVIDNEMSTSGDELSGDETSHKINELLSYTYQFPRYDIFVDVPDYNDIECGYTMIYKDGESKYITFNCFVDDTASGAKEAFDVSYPKFRNNVKSWYTVNEDSALTTSSVEVNGIETYNVAGTVNCGLIDIADCYIYGYSFVFEDVPCLIIGVVSDKTQPQEEIDSLTAIVDAMMASVRNEK